MRKERRAIPGQILRDSHENFRRYLHIDELEQISEVQDSRAAEVFVTLLFWTYDIIENTNCLNCDKTNRLVTGLQWISRNEEQPAISNGSFNLLQGDSKVCPTMHIDKEIALEFCLSFSTFMTARSDNFQVAYIDSTLMFSATGDILVSVHCDRMITEYLFGCAAPSPSSHAG